MDIESKAKNFLVNNKLSDVYDNENIDLIQSFLLKAVNKQMFFRPSIKKSFFKQKMICNSCKTLIVLKKKNVIIYCPYCGQRIKEKNYIVVKEENPNDKNT